MHPRSARAETPDVCVFAPSLILAITVEPSAARHTQAEIHLHPAGQAFWIARMLRNLGERPVLVAAVGGESGRVLRHLMSEWEIELDSIDTEEASAAYVHDRRDGQRREIARSDAPVLDRHETDDLYGRVLHRASASGTCVVTGRAPGDGLPLDFYRRLGADLRSVGVRAIGDLHGDELSAFLDGGSLHTLKMSDEDLAADETLPAGASFEQRLDVVGCRRLRNVERVVLSSGDAPTVARFGDTRLRADAPMLEIADHRGSGDAMTAGLTVGALHGLGPERTLQLACAAGAANVTRHGLGNVDVALVESLAERVDVRLVPEEA